MKVLKGYGGHFGSVLFWFWQCFILVQCSQKTAFLSKMKVSTKIFENFKMTHEMAGKEN